MLEIRRGLAESRPDNLDWQVNLATTVQDLGSLAYNLSRNDEALELYRQALELKKKLADSHPGMSRLEDDLAAAYNDMANVLLRQRDGEPEAMRLYQESLAIREKLVQAHPTVNRFQSRLAMEHYNIGLVLADRGRWGDATDCFRRARTLDLALIRANPSVADYRRDLAKDLRSLAYVSRRLRRGRVGQRVPWREGLGAAVAREPSNPEYRDELAYCLEGSAGLLESEGRLDEALAAHREALDLRRRLVQDRPHVGPYQNKLASSQFSFAERLVVAGRLDEARQAQHEGLAIREELVRAEPSVDTYKDWLAIGYTDVAWLAVEAGNSAAALTWLERAGAIFDQLAAKNPRDFVDRANDSGFQLVFATALEASGDFAGALCAYEQSRKLTEKMPVVYSMDHVRLACVYARRAPWPLGRDRAGHAAAAPTRKPLP